MVMVHFSPRLWVGDIEAARNTDALVKENIRCVLTCGPLQVDWCTHNSKDCASENPSDGNIALRATVVHNDWFYERHVHPTAVKHLRLNFKDTEDSNPLHNFSEGIKFIQKCLKQTNWENILIHCWAGQSRSPAICLAFLIKTQKIGYRLAHAMLQMCYPHVHIHPAFQMALKYYSTAVMRASSSASPLCHVRSTIRKLDDARSPTVPATMRSPLSALSECSSSASKTDRKYLCASSASVTPSIRQEMSTSSEGDTPVGTFNADFGGGRAGVGQSQIHENTEWFYSCRVCRESLFLESEVLPCHLTEKSRRQNFSGKPQREAPKTECSSIFLEAKDWMARSEPTGKIGCRNAKCQAKLGAYSWFGQRCSCGAWRTPAFMIHKAKVDRLPMRSPTLERDDMA